jgi:triose/dihydroxyacetone kinase / FAD-AMP lyase (cyclizing)
LGSEFTAKQVRRSCAAKRKATIDRTAKNFLTASPGLLVFAGLRQSPLLSADELAKELVDTIQAFGRKVVNKDGGAEDIVPMVAKGDEVVVLVNNLGGLSNFELSILARSCLRVLEGPGYGVKARRVLVGSYMTSFDMRGASLTILNVQDAPELVELLDAPTSAPAWNPYDVWTGSGADRPSAKPVPEVVADSSLAGAVAEAPLPELAVPDFSAKAATMLKAAVKKLAESESLLTEYDTIVGDGDCGMTFGRGAREIEARLSSGVISTDHPVTMFSDVADAVSTSMGGTSGVLLELMFRKISSSLRGVGPSTIGASEMAGAFQAGVDAVSLYGGATVGSRTMLDALVPAAAAVVGTQSLAEAAAEARQGADGTATMKVATAGRSNWLNEQSLEGTPDPGAIAVAVVFEAIVDA